MLLINYLYWRFHRMCYVCIQYPVMAFSFLAFQLYYFKGCVSSTEPMCIDFFSYSNLHRLYTFRMFLIMTSHFKEGYPSYVFYIFVFGSTLQAYLTYYTTLIGRKLPLHFVFFLWLWQTKLLMFGDSRYPMIVLQTLLYNFLKVLQIFKRRY